MTRAPIRPRRLLIPAGTCAACARGDAEARFPLSTRIAAIANGIAPELTSLALAFAARLLPPAESPAG